MEGILYEENSFWLFIFVSVVIGGAGGWMTGRSMAGGWRPVSLLVLYLLLLGLAVRFIHHALFNGTMFSLHYYVVDTIVVLIFGALAYRYTRASQMTTQYRWLYERTGPFSWAPRRDNAAGQAG